MKKQNEYLVNMQIPAKNDSQDISDYKNELVQKGFTRRQAAGSLGGASNGGRVAFKNGKVTRIKVAEDIKEAKCV